MTVLSEFGLRQPLWLLLIPAIVALHLWARHSAPKSARLSAYADRHLLRWLVVGDASRPRTRLTLLAWCLIVVAAAGPYIADPHAAGTRPELNIALIIDISPSMAADDVSPTRLDRARLEARELIRRLASDRVALIAFSANAYRVLPLTEDRALLSTYVDALDPGLTRRQGSNLAQALELAAQSLPASNRRGRAVVVLSDGETSDAAAVLGAADRLATQHIPVFTLGIGTGAGALVPGPTGYLKRADHEPVISRLDRSLLAQLAERSGGRYTDARLDGGDQGYLLDGLRAVKSDHLSTRAPAGYPLFPWILAAGLVLVMWTARDRFARMAGLLTLTPLVAAFSAISPAHAAPWSEHAAYEALTSGRYDEAAELYGRIDGYEGYLGHGAAVYRKGEWPQALASFTQAERLARTDEQRARALYNQANVLARMTRYAEAIADLDRALELWPNYPRAALNRDLIRRALYERSPSVAPEQDSIPRVAPEAPVAQAGEDGRDAQAPSASIHDGTQAGSRPGAGAPVLHLGEEGHETEAPVSAAPLGAAARSALAGLRALSDDPREVLRRRFMVADAAKPVAAEERPW